MDSPFSSRQRDREPDTSTGSEPSSKRQKLCEPPVASTSSSSHRDDESDPVTGIGASSNWILPSQSSNNYDVFINHKSIDVGENLAIPLHDSLKKAGFTAYLEKKANEPGHSMSSNIDAAIFSASVHIAIFSPTYPRSVWCLTELTSMLQTGAPIIPVYYNVNPTDLRLESKLYKDAFKNFKKKKIHLDDLESWKSSLAVVADIKGISNREHPDVNKLCKELVFIVKTKMAGRDIPLELTKLEVEERKIPLEVARYKVGLDGLVEEFETHLQKLCEGRGKMIGIWGIGGAGKTTLAKELFNRKCPEYSESSFLFNVREASVNGELTSLQSKLFRDLFHTHNAPDDVEKGIILLKYKLNSLSRFLIVIDDVDNLKQLAALVPLYTINNNSLVIVIAREESVLKKAGIRVSYEVKMMGSKSGKQLFSSHAFQDKLTCGYEHLVKPFVEKCGGLPLSLQVLGRYAFCKNKDTWHLELNNVPGTKDLLLESICKALDDVQKHIFLDIACIFIEKEVEMAKRIWWEAWGWRAAESALEALKANCLVDVVQQDFYEEPPTYVFRMHEELREIGRKMADSREPKRLCRPRKILDSHNFKDILEKHQEESIRCLDSIKDMSITYFLAKSKTSPSTLQWLELQLDRELIPEWIPLQNLEGLRVIAGVPKNLWQQNDQAFWKLKELICKFPSVIFYPKTERQKYWSEYSMSLTNLRQLECLILKLEPSPGRDVQVEWISFLNGLNSLKILNLSGLQIDGEIGISNCTSLGNLESLTLSRVVRTSKVSISGEYCPKLQRLKIEEMQDLIELDLGVVEILNCLEVIGCYLLKKVLGRDIPKLELLSIESCSCIVELPNLKNMRSLKMIRIIACEDLCAIEGIEYLSCVEDITITCCTMLQISRGMENLKGLKSIILSDGPVCRCVDSFQMLPSEFTVVMGRAAKPSVDEDQIRQIISTAGSPEKFESREEGYQKLRSLQRSEESFSAIILCAMVVASGPTYMDRRPQFGRTIRLSWKREEKLIYTIVVTDPNEISMVSHSIPGYCWMPTFLLENKGKCIKTRGEIEKGYILGMNKGQKCGPLEILKRLTKQLYKDFVELASD